MKMGFLFTSESVSEGHPDKVSDQISDAILDEFLRRDANSKVACETLCTTGLVVVAGEVRSDAYVDVQGVARRVINRIGYTKCIGFRVSSTFGQSDGCMSDTPETMGGLSGVPNGTSSQTI